MRRPVGDWRYAQLVKVKVMRTDGGEAIVGSGFALAPGVVLTARHVVKQLTGDQEQDARWWELPDRPIDALKAAPPEPGARSYRVGQVVVLDEQRRLDAVVLCVPDLPEFPMRSVGARLVGVGPLEGCRIVGFPVAATDDDSVRPEWVTSRLIPVSGETDGQVALDVTSARPGDRAWWQGLSGAAALDAEGRLLGLITHVPGRLDGRLIAAGVSALVDAAQATRDAAASVESGSGRGPDDMGALAALANLPIVEVDDADDVFDAELSPVPMTSLAGRSLFRILHHRSQVVPYVGAGEHDRLRSQITGWATVEAPSGPDVKVMVLTGPAGAGKSRLAAKICADLTEGDGWWRTGFVKPTRLRDAAVPRVPTLMVVDYAEHAPDLIGAYVARLQRCQDRGELLAPVRILLLARSLGPWWEDRLLGQVHDTVSLGGNHVRLTGKAFSRATRRAHARAAFNAFAQGLGRSDDYPGGLDSYAAALDRPLVVHIAALLAARGDQSFLEHARPVVKEELFKELLSSESRRWRRYGRPPEGDDPDFLTLEAGKEALTIATLTAPALRHVRDLLQVSATFAGTDSERRTAITEALHDLYPGPARPYAPEGSPEPSLAPVEPDLLAAYLLETTRERTRLITGLIDHPILAEHQIYHVRILEALSSAADSYPGIEADLKTHLASALAAVINAPEHTGPQLANLLTRHLGDLVRAAVARAAGQDLVTARQLALALTLSNVRDKAAIDEAAAESITSNLVPYHPGLTSLGIALAARALAHYEKCADTWGTARASGDLGAWLKRNNQYAESLAHFERSVALHEELVELNRVAYLPSLHTSVSNLTLLLAEMGRQDEALTAAKRGIRFASELVEIDRVAHLPELATSVGFLSNAYAFIGRPGVALKTSELAVKLHRELVETYGDAYQPRLAGSVSNLGVRLAEAGRWTEALTASEEAVRIHEELVEDDRAAHLPDLAMAVSNLANRLAFIGRQDEALVQSELAVTMRRELVETNGDAHLPDLAMSLNNLANRLGKAGRRTEALATSEEAVRIFQELVENYRTAHLPRLAMTMHNLAHHLDSVGRQDEALTALRQAVKLHSELVERSRAAHLLGLVSATNNLAFHLTRAAKQDEALAVAERLVGMSNELAESDRDAYVPTLAKAFKVAAVAQASFSTDQVTALDLLGRAIEYYRRLAEAEPERFTDDVAEVESLHVALTSESNASPEQEP